MVYYRPLLSRPQDADPAAPRFATGDLRITGAERLERGGASHIVALNDVPSDVIDAWCAPRHIAGHPLRQMEVMAVLNVTPDSFSDGGSFVDPQVIAARVAQIAQSGALMLDVGGESTRPGSLAVRADEEIARITPALEAAQAHDGLLVSLDTRKAQVAAHGLGLGVDVVNDVSGFTYDPKLAPLVAQRGVPVCIMHAQGDPQTMQENPSYDDVLLDVYDFLQERVETLAAMGIAREDMIVDPGIGFGKTLEHNLALLHRLSLFHSLGVSVLLGVSRKRFIGTIGGASEAKDRMAGSVAVGLHGAAQGVQILRVHDVDETIQALRLWGAMQDS